MEIKVFLDGLDIVPLKALVTGDRNWKDKSLIRDVLASLPPGSTVIQGGARGADSLAYSAARELNLKIETYAANWENYGRAAGPIRNRQMLDEAEPDVVLAFHDDIGTSKGTANMVRQALKRGIKVILYTHDFPTGIDCK